MYIPPMKIVLAPDSFKESLSAREAAAAMERGVRRVLRDAEVDACPIADGGEGTVEALVAATGGGVRTTRVRGPLKEMVEARWGVLGDGSAVIEMAATAGLHLVPVAARDPEKTTTLGVGELIRAALDAGATRIILGIGGSATCDGGCGMAGALGVRMYDRTGTEVPVPVRGGDLHCVARIDASGLDPRVKEAEVLVACDVTNPHAGPTGAAYVFGPQKGATPAQVERLDAGLHSLASVIRSDLGVDIADLPGAGAAGGLGGGAVAFLGASMRRGIDLVLDAVRFPERLHGADLVLTGEGRMDGQTLGGKAITGVATAAKRQGVPVVALVGSLGPGAEKVREIGVVGYRAIGEGLPVAESMRRAAELLEAATADAVAKWAQASR